MTRPWTRSTAIPGLVLMTVLGLGGASCNGPTSDRAAPEINSETTAAPVTAGGDDLVATTASVTREYRLVYRYHDELFIDQIALGIETGGPPRWRPRHTDQISYVAHDDLKRSGVFFFQQVRLLDVATGRDRVLLDVEDHGWTEAGHPDWDRSGRYLVFAAPGPDGLFAPHVLDTETDTVTATGTDRQIIDTAFAPDGRIIGVDTTDGGQQSEPVVWVASTGAIEPIGNGSGVNRDPAVSPDGRHAANIRASGPLARIFLGRWDLIVTDLETGAERPIGAGSDGFGPPRWIDENRLVAKHGRYNDAGLLAATPDTVIVDVRTDTINEITELPPGAWDPDPAPG